MTTTSHADLVSVTTTKTASGLFVATSEDEPGLFVACLDAGILAETLPAALRETVAARGGGAILALPTDEGTDERRVWALLPEAAALSALSARRAAGA